VYSSNYYTGRLCLEVQALLFVYVYHFDKINDDDDDDDDDDEQCVCPRKGLESGLIDPKTSALTLRPSK